jgi:predicted HicB family RNase H-like nuclease
MLKAKKPRVARSSTPAKVSVSQAAMADELQDETDVMVASPVKTISDKSNMMEVKPSEVTTAREKQEKKTQPLPAARPAATPATSALNSANSASAVKPQFHSQSLAAPKPAPRPASYDYDDEDENDMQPGARPFVKGDGKVFLTLSQALHTKLLRTAQDEGVSVEALATELLSEGVVLRAWEIIERKGAMRGALVGQQHGNNNFRPGNNSNNQRHGNRNNNRPNNNNRRPAPNNNWMEDKAAFLEYVRNQEKRRR